MYASCIKKELLTNILSFRYVLTFVLFVTLTMAATIIRTQIYKKQAKDYNAAVNERVKIVSEAGADRQMLQSLGLTVEKRPNPLSIFALGLENEMSRSFTVSERQLPVTGLRKLNNASFQYFLQLDMVLIINVVCSLLALLLIYDGVCGEREQGTLKMMLSGPLPRDVVIVSKLVAGLLTLLVPLAIAWVLSLVYATVVGKVVFSPDQMGRLMWIVMFSVFYISFVFSVGMAVSCWVQRSATSLAVCLFCWIMFVLAIPNFVPMIAKNFAPIPPQSKIALEKRVIKETIETDLVPKWREELGATGKYTDPNDLMGELANMQDEEEFRREAQIEQFYSSRIRRQLGLNQQISRISPSASYIYGSTQLAGTGVQDFLSLLAEVDRFQRSYTEIQDDLTKQQREAQSAQQANGAPQQIDPALLPRFEPRVISLAAAMNQCWIDLVLLVGGTVILLMVAIIGFVRYDVK